MSLFQAEIGKRVFLVSASSPHQANEIIKTYYPNNTVKIFPTEFKSSLIFRFGGNFRYTAHKIKNSIVYFVNDSGMTGKVDIELIPIELIV